MNRLLILPLLASLAFPAPSFSAPAPRDPIADFPNRVKKVTLDNGMRALIVERPESSTVSFVMFIRTGGIDDPMGESGIAHMFEHMLFKGTKTVGTRDYDKERPVLDRLDKAAEALQAEQSKGGAANPDKLKALAAEFEKLEAEHARFVDAEEYWKIYERAGAQDMNASTGYDYTNYIVSLPVEHIDLWFAMEADRIANPVLREFYKERSVVLEERRMRFDNSPGGKLWENFLAAAYLAHPYGRPIVGWESDISRVQRSDAERFFKTHYDVSRLVVGITGGVKAADIEARLRKNFGHFKSAPSQERGRIPVEPPQEGERRVEVLYDAEPDVLIGYHRPDMRHPDNAALEVLDSVLSTGRSSRLDRNVVDRKRIAVSAWASASAPAQRDPSLFTFGGTPRAPHTTADLEKAIYEEIEKLKKDGPTDAEMKRVKTRLESDVIRQMSSNVGLASELAYYESVAGDWRYLMELIQGIRSVTAADVARVARTYLVPENRTVAVIRKKEKKK